MCQSIKFSVIIWYQVETRKDIVKRLSTKGCSFVPAFFPLAV